MDSPMPRLNSEVHFHVADANDNASLASSGGPWYTDLSLPMEPVEKTTTLSSPDLRQTRLAAVKKLAELRLPVGTPEEMERESVEPIEPLA